jgi:glycosyltransferase involved in cell wall biosynthesis
VTTAPVQDRISVCICTFRRPALLDRLLCALERQIADEAFTFDVVVVDNDAERTAESTVGAARQRGIIDVRYDCEPEQNISLTRNRAVRNATGTLIAFIDDDEAPVPGWLAALYGTLNTYSADGVLGPVIAEFAPGTPEWIQRGPFFQRRRLATGTAISAKDARTGNLLLHRSIFADGEPWFDPAFGRTGGEDSDFFWRQSRTGRRFVWCDEAAAYEVVPPERCTASYHVKRYLRSGTLDGERMRAGRLASQGAIVRNAVIFCGCAAIAPFTLVLRKHISTRVFQKLAYCSGILTAYYGLSLLRYRD